MRESTVCTRKINHHYTAYLDAVVVVNSSDDSARMSDDNDHRNSTPGPAAAAAAVAAATANRACMNSFVGYSVIDIRWYARWSIAHREQRRDCFTGTATSISAATSCTDLERAKHVLYRGTMHASYDLLSLPVLR